MRPLSLIHTAGVATLVLTLSLSLSSCLKKEQQTTAPQMMPEMTVETIKPVIKDVPVFKEWVGSLTGKVNATIMPQVSGYLKEQVYNNGGVVKKGDVLFRIDDRTFKAALDQATSDLAKAQAALVKNQLDVERYTPLVKTNAVSQKQLDDAILATRESQAAVEACQAAIDQAKLNLGFTIVESPIDGIAGIAKAQIGDLVSPGGMILTSVSSVDPIRLDFAITEQDWLNSANQSINEKQQLSLESTPNLEIILANGEIYNHKGRAIAVNREVNTNTGTINIVGEIDNPHRLLRPGMFVRVRANVNTVRNAMVVPARAIVSQQGAYYVVIVGKDGFPSILPVKPGVMVGQEQVFTPMFEGSITTESEIVVSGVLQAMMRAPKIPGDAPKGKLLTTPYNPTPTKALVPGRELKPADKPEPKEEGKSPSEQPKDAPKEAPKEAPNEQAAHQVITHDTLA